MATAAAERWPRTHTPAGSSVRKQWRRPLWNSSLKIRANICMKSSSPMHTHTHVFGTDHTSKYTLACRNTEKHKHPHRSQRSLQWMCCRTSAHSPDFCGGIWDCFKAKQTLTGWGEEQCVCVCVSFLRLSVTLTLSDSKKHSKQERNES